MITNWQPMTTAPKDGTRIWAASKCGKVLLSYWGGEGDGRWIMFGTKEKPLGWHEYFKPEHPGAEV